MMKSTEKKAFLTVEWKIFEWPQSILENRSKTVPAIIALTELATGVFSR